MPCPLIYHDSYNISACGIEKLHPFDTSKWGKVVEYLRETGLANDASFREPEEVSEEMLLRVHDRKYLKSLRSSIKVAQIVEIGPVTCLPSCVIDSRLLYPLRLQTGGTILAAELALEHGCAINIGGGAHHASANSGGGFCFYADITLAIRNLLDAGKIRNAIIVDLDAHQGNGHERDFQDNQNVFIFDVFNPNMYPRDREARQFIDKPIYVDYHTTDGTYISQLRKNLKEVLESKKFDFMLYNAGTDCLIGDPIGGLNLSEECIIKRDEIVFEMAKSFQVPICMVTSGGYQKNNAQIIAKSLENLCRKNLIKFFLE